jgi:hypothetical protein
MATSGSTDWSLNRDQVITGALRKLAVLPSGGSPSTEQTSDASSALNALVKAFQADGMPVWKITETTFTVTSGTNSYTVGPSQTVTTVGAPLKVLQALYTPTGGNNTPMNVYNRYDFNMLPSSSSTGFPINLYYQPLGATGTIKLWPTPSDSTTEITIHYQTPYEDMDAASDDFDFPSYWTQALIMNLAWVMAPEYSIPPTDRTLLQKEADYWHTYALSLGSEEGSMYMMPNNTL